MKFKLDWFLIGMGAAVALAWLFPAPGGAGGWTHPELLTKAGIALIFFLHGLALSFAALKAGTLRWPLHLVVQLCTFVLFPLIGVGLMAALDGRVSQELQWGVFYLCALPSTVSSSVALTAAARGNVPGALFNATLSSMLGVFLTPLWMAWAMRTSGTTMPLSPSATVDFAWSHAFQENMNNFSQPNTSAPIRVSHAQDNATLVYTYRF